jgi:hypothetical protein
VSTKLDDLALEINHIKENKPYSIVILEDQINALKKEKLELRRTNNDQQERIINMSCTISDLKSTNRNLEDEKSSLLTAIRLIKSDYSKLGIKAAVREVENEGPATWKVPKQNARSKPASPQTEDSNVTSALETSNQYAIFTEANTNGQQKQMPTKSYGSEQSQHVRQQDPVVTRRTSMTKTRSRVAVLGDSMIKHINPRQLQNGVKPKIAVKTFPGATIADMSHYAKPTLSTAPDEIILHIGTNDLKAKTPEAVINAAANLGESITQLHKDTKLTFSEIITRVDDESLTRKVTLYNSLLAKLCLERNWQLISHNNIDKSHLNSYGLHLNKNGTSILAKNIKHFLITKYSKDI